MYGFEGDIVQFCLIRNNTEVRYGFSMLAQDATEVDETVSTQHLNDLEILQRDFHRFNIIVSEQTPKPYTMSQRCISANYNNRPASSLIEVLNEGTAQVR